ncbi:MAG TPA: hypothetical protein VK084_08675, partial [Chitinophagaceae bacterium]|nr:hypothetical protein [Chitinophagaceae bacterium]
MKNKLVYLLILLGLFLTNRSSAQISDSNNVASVFKVQGFSDRYEAKVYLKDPQAVFSAGWVAVYDKKSGKELLKIASEDLPADFVDDEVEANVHERPYGKQNVLIYEDFNFDGQKDLAISDGNHSCYGGPSYQIYLADAGGFS